MKKIDPTNSKYGKLTLLEYVRTDKRGKPFWRCKCDCGNETITELYRVRGGGAKSCGCSRTIDIVGKKFGRLTVISLDHKKPILVNGKRSGNHLYWKCKCDCGSESVVSGGSLRSGLSKSCGCRTREAFSVYCDTIRKPFGEAASHAVYVSYKKGAKRRSIAFDLAENIFKTLVLQRCFYCNAEPGNIAKSKNYYGEFVYNGIDRVDNNLGYIEGNCVPCCKKCNSMKEKHSKDDFAAHITKIYDFFVAKKAV